jgi:hypothetical protein
MSDDNCFLHLEDVIDGPLTEAINGLFESDNPMDFGHYAADTVRAIGETLEVTLHSVGCSTNDLGDTVEALAQPYGPTAEMGGAIVGETLEGIAQVSTVGVAEPITEALSELLYYGADSGHDALNCIEHLLEGNFSEASQDFGEIASNIPDLTQELGSTLPEIVVNVTGEVVEAFIEVGAEFIEGVGEILESDSIEEASGNEK